MALLGIVGGVTTIAVTLLLIERSQSKLWRNVGPWLLMLALCAAVVIAVPPTLERYSWLNVRKPHFLHEMAGGLGFLVPFAVTAVLVARAWLRVTRRPLVFVPAFVGTTLLVWLVTLMVWSSVIPGS